MSHYDNRIGRFLEKVMSHYELKTNGVQTELQTDRQLDRVSCTLGAPSRYSSAGLSLAHNAQDSSTKFLNILLKKCKTFMNKNCLEYNYTQTVKDG